MKPCPHVHDLLGPIPVGSVIADVAAEQPLIDECLHHAPFAVVRRLAPREDLIAIGIRGTFREQRYAGWLPTQHITGIRSPESLSLPSPVPAFPAFAALVALRRRWQNLELPWGPIGSVGFALASGAFAVSDTSDLDLLIRAEHPITIELAQELLRESQSLPCRVDIQIETPLGSVALAELAANSGPILLRSSSGVSLTRSPWQAPLEVLA